jgi:hypothetical protein
MMEIIKMSKDVVPHKDKGFEISLPPLSDIATITDDIKTSPERRRLLAVLTLPQTTLMSITDICLHAQVNPITYYRAIKDPEFNLIQVKLARQQFASNTLKYRHTYSRLALAGDRQALERINEQIGVLDPPQRNVNIQGAIVNTTMTELLALIKEQKVDNEDIADIVEVIETEQDEGDMGDSGHGAPCSTTSPVSSEQDNGEHGTAGSDEDSVPCSPDLPDSPKQDGGNDDEQVETVQGKQGGDSEGKRCAGGTDNGGRAGHINQDGEGSTPDEGEVPGIPKENIGPSLSPENTENKEK